MKKTGIRLLIAAASIALLSAAAIFVIPKVVLYNTLTTAAQTLIQRFEGDPLGIVLRTLDPEGKYTLSGSMKLTGNFPAEANLEGILKTDLSQHRFLAEGTVCASDKALDLSVYLDPGYLAVSSQQLTEGKHYGITYETFPEDIRSIPLLNVFISDTVFSRWEESLLALQKWTMKEYPRPYLPQLPEDPVRTLITGLLTMPCSAENRTLTINGETLDCRALTWSVNGELLKNVHPLFRKDTTVTATIYLNRSRLAAAQCMITSDKKTSGWFLQPGRDLMTDPITLQYTDCSGNITRITADTQRLENRYRESWEIGIKGEEYRVFYDWEKESGKILLRIRDAPEICEGYLEERENGFSFRSSQLEKLFPADKTGSQRPVSCDLTLVRDSDIAAPAYKNLDQWSLEDFLILAEGIGTWIGLRFN